jgi:uncharacterized OsmC-like protein
MVGMMNGVNVKELAKQVEAVQATPALAKFEFRATNRWLDGGHNRTSVKEFSAGGQEDTQRWKTFVLEADEPAALLGQDYGANPAEHLLHALIGCLTTSMVYHAAARGIRIERVESRLEGDIDARGFLGVAPEVRKGFQGIRVTMRVTSDAPAEALASLCAFSPIYDTIRNPVPVSLVVGKA